MFRRYITIRVEEAARPRELRIKFEVHGHVFFSAEQNKFCVGFLTTKIPSHQVKTHVDYQAIYGRDYTSFNLDHSKSFEPPRVNFPTVMTALRHVAINQSQSFISVHARVSSLLTIEMFFWGLKLVLASSFVATVYSQSPDATTYYRDMIDNVFPKTLSDYNTAIKAFPSANATPEDIDVSFFVSFLHEKVFNHTNLTFLDPLSCHI